MFTVIKNSDKLMTMGLLSLALYGTHAMAGTMGEVVATSGAYVGVFGGGGASGKSDLHQVGGVFLPTSQGGTLEINARGSADNHSTWITGLRAGFEWQEQLTVWNLISAAELEGYYLGAKKYGSHLINLNNRIPEHLFRDEFPTDTGVLLVNGVFGVQAPSLQRVQPYVGAGVGTAVVSVSNAKSIQLSPAEPGVNHFNSNSNATTWTFATQAKAGLRFSLTPRLRLFTEYRFLYLASTNYRYGSTQYTGHPTTTHWNVHYDGMSYNMGAVGLDYRV